MLLRSDSGVAPWNFALTRRAVRRRRKIPSGIPRGRWGQSPPRLLANDCQRMAALSQKIGELAADGIIDPAELRRLALESWPLWRAPRGTY